MEKSRVTYQIEHNTEDFYFPITVKTLYDGNVVFTDFATTIEEAGKRMSERESNLKDDISEEKGIDL